MLLLIELHVTSNGKSKCSYQVKRNERTLLKFIDYIIFN